MKIGVIYLFESFNKGEINHELDLQLVFSVFFSQNIYSQLLQIFIFTVLNMLLLRGYLCVVLPNSFECHVISSSEYVVNLLSKTNIKEDEPNKGFHSTRTYR